MIVMNLKYNLISSYEIQALSTDMTNTFITCYKLYYYYFFIAIIENRSLIFVICDNFF